MNSEPWRELWIEQPVAPPAATPDRLLAQIRGEAAAWEDEWARGERQALIAPLWMPLILAFDLLRNSDWLWAQGVVLAALVVWYGLLLWLRERRRQIEREFGSAVCVRLERVRAMLQQRRRWCGHSRWMVVPLALAFGLMPVEMVEASPWVGLAVGVAAAIWLGWWFEIERGRELARIDQRLAAIEHACASLAPRDHA